MPPPTPHRRALRWAIAGACVVVLAACSGGSAGSDRPATGPSTSPSISAATSASTTGVRHVQVGHLPCATLGAAGAVWVALYGDNEVRRIDPATLKVSAPITTGAQPCGMAYGGGSVWVEDYGDNTVTRIDPATDATRMYDVGKAPYDVTFAFGAAWTSNFNDGTVSRIDAASGSIRTVTVGNSPTGIMHAGDSVWVTNQSDGTVSRIDPTGRHVRTVTVGGRVAWTAADGERLWIGSLTNGGPGQSVQIDAATGKVVRRSPIGPTPNDPDVLDGGVWWPDKNGSLYRVGEQDGAVTGPWPLGAANPFVAAAFDHRLWIAAFGGSDVVVVDPTRLPPS